MSYLHFTRGVLTTVALLGWIAWTLYEYRAKFQQVVRQHDDQFVRILDNTSEAVVVTDANHKITFWNKAAQRHTGLEARRSGRFFHYHHTATAGRGCHCPARKSGD